MFDARAKRGHQSHASNKCFSGIPHVFFFLLEDHKVDLFGPQVAIKSTLRPASKKLYSLQLGKKSLFCDCEV